MGRRVFRCVAREHGGMSVAARPYGTSDDVSEEAAWGTRRALRFEARTSRHPGRSPSDALGVQEIDVHGARRGAVLEQMVGRCKAGEACAYHRHPRRRAGGDRAAGRPLVLRAEAGMGSCVCERQASLGCTRSFPSERKWSSLTVTPRRASSYKCC